MADDGTRWHSPAGRMLPQLVWCGLLRDLCAHYSFQVSSPECGQILDFLISSILFSRTKILFDAVLIMLFAVCKLIF